MKRRQALLALLALSAPSASPQPAQKVHRVGFIATVSPPSEITGPEPANPLSILQSVLLRTSRVIE